MKTQKLDVRERTSLYLFLHMDMTYPFGRVSKSNGLIFAFFMAGQKEGGNTNNYQCKLSLLSLQPQEKEVVVILLSKKITPWKVCVYA